MMAFLGQDLLRLAATCNKNEQQQKDAKNNTEL